MNLPRQIAAGGFLFKDNAVLLVRYHNRNNNTATYLVAPGGAVEDDENVVQAIIREIKEETGIAAHIWQLLMGLQLPIIAFFVIKWLPRAPRLALYVLALQACFALLALAPVYFLKL